jgi:hypothetical protein
MNPFDFDDPIGEELERVRESCANLGADDEMTALVLASHRHDRSFLEVVLAEGGNLQDYVRLKLAIWDEIFGEESPIIRSATPPGPTARGQTPVDGPEPHPTIMAIDAWPAT